MTLRIHPEAVPNLWVTTSDSCLFAHKGLLAIFHLQSYGYSATAQSRSVCLCWPLDLELSFTNPGITVTSCLTSPGDALKLFCLPAHALTRVGSAADLSDADHLL